MRRCSIVTRPVSSASRRGLDFCHVRQLFTRLSVDGDQIWKSILRMYRLGFHGSVTACWSQEMIEHSNLNLVRYIFVLKLRVRVCTSLKQLFFSLFDNGGRQFMTISQCNCWFKFSGDTSNFEQFLRKIWVKSTYQACKQFHEKLIYNLSLDKVSQIYSDLCLLLKRIIG